MGARSSPGAEETIHGGSRPFVQGANCEACGMRTRSRVVVPLALLTAVLAGSALVTGCSDDEEPTPPASAAGSSTPTAQEPETPVSETATEEPAGTDLPPFPGDTSADT